MAVMDEFREEREALKNADFKKKWQYFLDYYKWYVISGAAALIFIVSLLYSILTAKESALHGYFINTVADESKVGDFINAFAEHQSIDLNEYEMMIDVTLHIEAGSIDEMSVTSAEKLMVTIAASEVDFIAADQSTFLQYATTDTFFDLREIFTEEELAKFKDYIYYIDMDVVREKEEIVDSGQFEDYVAAEYDHFAPEEMGDPIPIALCIQDCPKLQHIYYFTDDIVPMAVVVNTQRLDNTLGFIDYLFEDLVP